MADQPTQPTAETRACDREDADDRAQIANPPRRRSAARRS